MKRVKVTPEEIHEEIKEYAEEVAAIVGEEGDPIVRSKLQHIIMNCQFLNEKHDKKMYAVRMLEKYWHDVLPGARYGAMHMKDRINDETEFLQFLRENNFIKTTEDKYIAGWIIHLLEQGELCRVAETLRSYGDGYPEDISKKKFKIEKYMLEYHGIALNVDLAL